MEDILPKLQELAVDYKNEENSFIESLTKRNELSQNYLSLLTSINKTINEAIRQINGELDLKQKEYEALDNKVKILQMNHSESINTYTKKIEESKSVLVSLDKEYNELSIKNENLQHIHDSYVIRREKDKEDMIAMTNKISDLESEYRSITQEITQLTAQRDNLASEVGDLSNQRDSVNNELRIKNEEINRINIITKNAI